MPVLDLDLLQGAIIVGHSVAMLLLPLLSDFLLLYHDVVGTLLVTLVTLFGLQELVLQMGHLHVALVVKLIHTTMEDDLETIQLGD